jgi:hypothetical protein
MPGLRALLRIGQMCSNAHVMTNITIASHLHRFVSIFATMTDPKPPKVKRKASSSPSKDDSSKAKIKKAKAKASSGEKNDNIGPDPVAPSAPQAKLATKKDARSAPKAKTAIKKAAQSVVPNSKTDQSAQKSPPKINQKNVMKARTKTNSTKPFAAQLKTMPSMNLAYLNVVVDYKASAEEESDVETVSKPKVQQISMEEIAEAKIGALVYNVQKMTVDEFLSCKFKSEDEQNGQTFAQYLGIIKRRRDEEEEETMASMGQIRTQMKGVQGCAVWYYDLLHGCSSRLGNFDWMAFLIAVWLGKRILW